MESNENKKISLKKKLAGLLVGGCILYSAGIVGLYALGNHYRNSNQEEKAIKYLNYAANLFSPLRKETSAYVLQVLDKRTQYYESMKMYLNYHTKYEEEKGMGNRFPVSKFDTTFADIKKMYTSRMYSESIDDTFLTFVTYRYLSEELTEKYQADLYKNYTLLSVKNPKKLISWVYMYDFTYTLYHLNDELFMYGQRRSFSSHPERVKRKLQEFNNKYEEISPVNYIYLDIEYALMASKAVRGIKEYMKTFPKEVSVYKKEYDTLCKNISSISLKYKDETENYPDLDRVLEFIDTSLSR